MSIWKQFKNVTGTWCESHTKESGIVSTEGSVRGSGNTFTCNFCDIHTRQSSKIPFRKSVKNVWQSEQHVTGTLCDSDTKRGYSSTETVNIELTKNKW